jgi:hypothetical protein
MLELDLGTAHGRLTRICAADVSSSGGGLAQPMTRLIASYARGAQLLPAGIEFACLPPLRHESP